MVWNSSDSAIRLGRVLTSRHGRRGLAVNSWLVANCAVFHWRLLHTARLRHEVLIPTAFGLIGAVFLVQAYLVNAEFFYWYEERIAGASGVEQQILELGWEARGDIVDELLLNIGSWLTMSLSLFLFALFGWRSKHVPRWIHIVGLITIVSGLGWLTPWPIPIEFGLHQLPSFLTLVIWSVGIGIVMVRYREDGAVGDNSQ